MSFFPCFNQLDATHCDTICQMPDSFCLSMEALQEIKSYSHIKEYDFLYANIHYFTLFKVNIIEKNLVLRIKNIGMNVAK
jgi:hypothetical protein